MAFITLAKRQNRDSQKTTQKRRVLQQTFANEKDLQICSVIGLRKSFKFCEAAVSFIARGGCGKSIAFDKFGRP